MYDPVDNSRIFIKGSLLFLVLSVALLALFQDTLAQNREMFDVKKLSKDVRTRFSLSNRDVKAIDPLIKVENFRTAEIYSRFGGEEADYSGRFWHQLIEDRLRFESEIGTLTNKQQKAIRSARSRLEKRLVKYLIDDYVALLDQVLSFREIEFNDTTKVFELEADKKLYLLLLHISKPSVLMRELDKVTKETRASLRNAMSREQWEDFSELTKESEDLIG